MKFYRLRILCNFYIFIWIYSCSCVSVRVRGKQFEKPSNLIDTNKWRGSNENENGNGNGNNHERKNFNSNEHIQASECRPPDTEEARPERSAVALSESEIETESESETETIGEDIHIRHTKQNSIHAHVHCTLPKNHNELKLECAEHESEIMDGDVQFEARCKRSKNATTPTCHAHTHTHDYAHTQDHTHANFHAHDHAHAPSNKAASFVSRIISTYMHFLVNHALVTKIVTAGLISGLADICAQCFEQRVDVTGTCTGTRTGARTGTRTCTRTRTSTLVWKMIPSLDRRRLFGMVFESVCVSGPIMHYAYDFMEDLVPVHGSEDDESASRSTSASTSRSTSTIDGHEQGEDKSTVSVSSLQRWFAAAFHLLLDIVVLGPIFVLSLMVTTSIIEGKVESLKAELMTQYIPALWASTLTSIGFIPTQLLAFRFLPVRFRLLFVNVQDVVWDAIVSFMVHKAR